MKEKGTVGKAALSPPSSPPQCTGRCLATAFFQFLIRYHPSGPSSGAVRLSARHPGTDPWVGLAWAIDVTTKFAVLRVPRVAGAAKEAAGSF